MLKSFRMGGIHPQENKLSATAEIKVLPVPKSVRIPLNQHIGAPALPIVGKGDRVKVGQVVGSAKGFVSSNIHSSVSGIVTSVDEQPDGAGVKQQTVTIQVERDEWLEGVDRESRLVSECNLSSEQIIKKIAEAGVVGLGGATFPTQVKLSIPQGKTAQYLIINGVECEPYLTADHRVMLERAKELIVGTEILAKALGVEQTYIGIENNKRDAIDLLRGLVSERMEVVPLKVKYPQGGEKQLIAAVTKREVSSGTLPIEVGVVVQNVGTALAVYEAVQKNKPLVERVVTVTGKGLTQPANLLVRVGTAIEELIEYCGGLPKDGAKVISGGPMMGRAVVNLNAPVTKGTSGVLIIGERETKRPSEGVCIKCTKCIEVCPMGLTPYMLFKLGHSGKLPEMEPLHVTDCIECGSCSFTCPARLPLLDYIRLGKVEVMKIMRSRRS